MRDVVRSSGVSSRTLRHYDQVGLLTPSSVGVGGERRYDESRLIRLQRILVLRGLGLGLAAIGTVLDHERDEVQALREHAEQLRQESERIARKIAAVEHSIAALSEGSELNMDKMFEGYDHRQYEAEVEQRWGKDTARRSTAWWEGLTQEERADWQGRAADLGHAWTTAAAAGLDPRGDEAQALAARHLDWLRSVPGAPTDQGEEMLRTYVLGLADMYVADPRFAANYGGETGAGFVRATLRAHFGLED